MNCGGLFIPKAGGINIKLRRGKTVKKQCNRVSSAHPIYRSFIQEYALESRLCQSKRKAAELTNDEGTLVKVCWERMMKNR
jgi:hypothetical protein